MSNECPVQSCNRPEEAARGAVKHVFEILGVDIDDPKQVEAFRRGLRFGEDMLMYSKKSKIAILISLIGLLSATVWKLIWGNIQ